MNTKYYTPRYNANTTNTNTTNANANTNTTNAKNANTNTNVKKLDDSDFPSLTKQSTISTTNTQPRMNFLEAAKKVPVVEEEEDEEVEEEKKEEEPFIKGFSF